MKGALTTFWGKLQQESGRVEEWHPLVDHCADVAAVAEMLLSLPMWRERLQHAAGSATFTVAVWARLCVFAAFHDIGKFNLGFQAKGRHELGSPAGHVGEALGVLGHVSIRPVVAPLGEWGDAAGPLLVASICHHGQPVREVPYQQTWWAARDGLDPVAGAIELLQLSKAWFPAAFDAVAPDLPRSTALEHAFAGLVMLADWLGSSREYFPYSQEGDSNRMTFARGVAGRMAEEMFLSAPAAQRSDRRHRSAFARVAPPGFKPRPAQQAILETNVDSSGSIVVLESETGSGKTEAALAHFVSLYERGLVDGLYFALPTRTAATQIFERVQRAVAQAFEPAPPVTLAVPGYLRVDEATGERLLPGFEVLWPDRDRFRFRGWAAEHPKRYLGAAVAAGTIDQVLLSGLMVGHAHLRATALLSHLLVVDEVHASDAYMTRILEEILARHLGAGGHALLLSATLGAESRERLLCPLRRRNAAGLDEAIATPYPLVTAADGHGHLRELGAVSDKREKVVRLVHRQWMETAYAVAAHALEAAKSGAAVIVVKNTVNDCIETQRALEVAAGANARTLLFGCNGVAAPHHARFARTDRQSLDRSLEARFGRDRGAGGCVIVATQTVQQSLDIDADIIITDLCPADVLLQRLGRLHRHVRVRPAGFDEPRAIVVVPSHRDLGRLLSETGRPRHFHGLGTVYPDLRILEATWRLVEGYGIWNIPSMNRMLVERTVHSEALAAIAAEVGGKWLLHEREMVGIQRGMGRHAELNLVDWSRPYGETLFPDHLDRRISTRLGEGDRRVLFVPPIRGPFDASVSELLLRAPWVTGADSEESTASDVHTEGGITRFKFSDRPFVYDRLGLRPDRLNVAQKQRGDGDDGT